MLSLFSALLPLLYIELEAPPQGHCVHLEASALNIRRDSPALRFVLENRCTISVRVPPRELPWGSSFSVTLSAVTQTDPANLLAPLEPLYHDDHEAIELPAGESLKGDAYLNGWFADFAGENRKTDILVHWVYRMPKSLGTGSEAGTVLFPRLRNP